MSSWRWNVWAAGLANFYFRWASGQPVGSQINLLARQRVLTQHPAYFSDLGVTGKPTRYFILPDREIRRYTYGSGLDRAAGNFPYQWDVLPDEHVLTPVNLYEPWTWEWDG